MPHQRSDTRLPTASERDRIHTLIGITQPPQNSPAGAPWDGLNDAQKRTELAEALTKALTVRMTETIQAVAWKETAHPLPLTSLYGAGEAAREVVDEVLRPWVVNAALDPPTQRRRQGFAFRADGANPTLINTLDSKARASAGRPVNPADMAKYFAATDATCQKIMKSHSFRPYADTAVTEAAFLRQEVLDPFIAQNKDDLGRCDLLGYALADPGNGTIFVSPVVASWDGRTEADPLVVARKWELFRKCVHEYIHILQHPWLPSATGDCMVMREGVCEYLTREVIRGVGAFSAPRMKTLAQRVAGNDQPPAPAAFTGYQIDGAYTRYVTAVEEVMTIVGRNAVLGAFLQGHVEFLGLRSHRRAQDGVETRPAAGANDPPWRLIPSPLATSVNSVAKLAAGTGLALDRIRADNPALPHPGDITTPVLLPGFHGHYVVFVRDETDDDRPYAETWAQIADQNGATEAELRTVNRSPAEEAPPSCWVLVPDHP